MICSKNVLTRAILSYTNYKTTASNHLQQCRDKWIPVHVRKVADKRRVRECAEAIIMGKPYLQEYSTFSLEHQLAVVLCLMTGWSDHLWAMGKSQSDMTLAQIYTERVFSFLNSLSVDFAALGVRGFSNNRDGGAVPAMALYQKYNMTRIRVFMTVFLKIRDHWNKVGHDWSRKVD
jgi:hypothetical protein